MYLYVKTELILFCARKNFNIITENNSCKHAVLHFCFDISIAFVPNHFINIVYTSVDITNSFLI